jgi:glutathione peroxidase-family protein
MFSGAKFKPTTRRDLRSIRAGTPCYDKLTGVNKVIKYLAKFNRVEKVDVAGETEHFVKLLHGRKEAKKSDWVSYFDSFDDAKKFLLDKAQKRVDSLRRQLESANGELGQIKGIKES